MRKHTKKVLKSKEPWELKHLSTKREKSTEIPKVVASEIGKLVEMTEDTSKEGTRKRVKRPKGR